jgi:DNA-binding beta-propeller fold protein YncE
MPAEVPIMMANFLMPKNTSDAEVIDEANVDPDIRPVGTIAVRRGPIGDIAVAGDGTTVVTNYGNDTVALLNPHTLALEGLVAVPGEPFAVAASDDRLFVSTTSSTFDAVSVIDTNTHTVIGTYSLAFSVTALAVSPDGKRVYAGRTGDGYVDVAVIDTTAERVGTIDIATGAGIGIDALEIDPTGKSLYVATTDARGSALVVVDVETARIDTHVPVGSPIRDIAFGDGSAYVLTSDRARGGAVDVIDLSAGEITNSVELGVGAPTQLTLSADKAYAYIVDYDRISVLCMLSLEVVNTVKVDARPAGVAVDSNGGRLYVADYSGGVTVFSVASAMPMLYSEFMSTDPIRVPEARELEPATV